MAERYGFSAGEIAALQQKEIGEKAILESYKRDLKAAIFTRKLKDNVLPSDAFFTYNNRDVIPIETSRQLPVPVISVSRTDTLRPRVEVPQAFDHNGNELLVMFEFDVTPEFNSPNYWRTPTLLQNFSIKDRSSRDGIGLRLQTPLETRGFDNVVDFPFRASAMRLPLKASALSPDEMMKQGRALAYGLSHDETIAEVFNYARFMYHWGRDELMHSPYDTFVSSTGECGYINQLAGTFLEFNGIRYRSVSGFNPIARTVNPGGGHTAIEVYNPETDKWWFFDSYLNILLDGPIQLAHETDAGQRVIYPLPKEVHDRLGPDLSLAELFRFRRYFDIHSRARILPMQNLMDEKDYGLGWEILEAPKYALEALFPESLTIYVRARYIDTDGQPLVFDKVRDGVFSAVAETHFKMAPISGIKNALMKPEPHQGG